MGRTIYFSLRLVSLHLPSPCWNTWKDRNRRKGALCPSGSRRGSKKQKDKVHSERCYTEQMMRSPSYLQPFSLCFFILPWVEELVKECVKQHNHSFSVPLQDIHIHLPSQCVCVCMHMWYACVSTCAPTAANSWVPTCIISTHQLS